MKWTALNGIGAVLWFAGLTLVLGVSHAGAWQVWLPANPLPIGGLFGLIGLATLLWANLSNA